MDRDEAYAGSSLAIRCEVDGAKEGIRGRGIIIALLICIVCMPRRSRVVLHDMCQLYAFSWIAALGIDSLNLWLTASDPRLTGEWWSGW